MSGVRNRGKAPFMFSAIPTSAGHVVMAVVCVHPGAVHVVDAAGRVPFVFKQVPLATEEEVEMLELVGQTIELCGGEVALIEWGTERGTTPTMARHLPWHTGQMQPVWRPTSTAPLWVCPEHAAHYRTRASGAAKKVIQQ